MNLLIIMIWTLELLFKIQSEMNPPRFKIDRVHLQSLDIGPCRNEPDEFCQRHIINSFCSVEKNECFCKPGFISIQEDGGLICKTLLTNLKCHVDGDCIHVDNSACHPGAGSCICPAGTIYIAQEHGCRKPVYDQSSPFCINCNRIHGQCYLKHRSINYQKHVTNFEYGCNCPGTTAMVTPQIGNLSIGSKSSSEMGRNDFCRAILVDISSYCNNEDILCRPRNSQCTKLNDAKLGRFISICKCQSNHWPVYQTHLGYHECYPKCPVCSNNFRNKHNRRIGNYGCVCPDDLLETGVQQYDLSDQVTSIEVSCGKSRIQICCESDRSGSSANKLKQRFDNSGISYITSQMNSLYVENECILEPIEKTKSDTSDITSFKVITEYGKLCKTVHFNDAEPQNRCGLRRIHTENQTLYYGYLTREPHPLAYNGHRRNQYELSCVYDSSNDMIMNYGRAKQINTKVKDQRKGFFMWPEPVVDFFLTTDKEQRQDVVQSDDHVRLHVTLDTINSPFKFILVEFCSVAEEVDGKTMVEIPFVHKGCPFPSSGRLGKLFVFETENSDRTHSITERSKHMPIKTNLIPVYSILEQLAKTYLVNENSKHEHDFNQESKFVISSKSNDYRSDLRIKIRCVFRLCSKSNWCNPPKHCNFHDQINIPDNPIYEEPNLVIIFQTTEFLITQSPNTSLSSTTFSKDKSTDCGTEHCPGNKLMPIYILISILSFCLFMLLFVIALYYYRYWRLKMYLRNHMPENSNQLSQTSCSISQCNYYPSDIICEQPLSSLIYTKEFNDNTDNTSFTSHLNPSSHIFTSLQQHQYLDYDSNDHPNSFPKHHTHKLMVISKQNQNKELSYNDKWSYKTYSDNRKPIKLAPISPYVFTTNSFGIPVTTMSKQDAIFNLSIRNSCMQGSKENESNCSSSGHEQYDFVNSY